MTKNTGIDKESQEILDEIAEEEGSEVETKETPEPEVETEDEPTEDTPEEDVEEVDEPKEDTKEKDSKQVDRPVRSMPIAKYQKKKDKWKSDIAERDDKIAELEKRAIEVEENTPEAKKIASEAEKLSEKYNVDKGFISELTDTIKKSIKPNPEINALLAREKQAKQDNMFDDEIDALLEDSSISDEDKDNIKSKKSEIKDLAFTEENKNSSAYEIFFRKVKPTLTGKKTAETSKGRTANDLVDYDRVTDEDIDKMSSKEFDKYSEYMEKNHSKPRFTVT